MKNNETNSEDDVDCYIRRSRMYYGYNCCMCLRSVVISPFSKDVLSCEAFHKWADQATVSRMGKNKDGKSGVLLIFKFTDQGDEAFSELKRELSSFSVSVSHPKLSSVYKDIDEVVDILTQPVSLGMTEGGNLAKNSAVLEKVPASLLVEEMLAPFFPEAIDLFIFPNHNDAEYGEVVIQFENEQDLKTFLDKEKNLKIKDHSITAKRFTTIHKHVQRLQRKKGEEVVNLDDETRIEMCRDFHSKDDKKWEVLSGDQYKGAEKLKVCDRMEKHYVTLKRKIRLDTDRRIKNQELEMPESEELMLNVTTMALEKAAENGNAEKQKKLAKKRPLAEVKMSKPLPHLKPLPPLKPLPTLKPLKPLPPLKPLKPLPSRSATLAKATVEAMKSTLMDRPPAKVMKMTGSNPFTGNVPIGQTMAALRKPVNIHARHAARWEEEYTDAGHLQEREQFRGPRPNDVVQTLQGLPGNETAALVDNLANAFVSKIEQLKRNKPSHQTLSRFYAGEDPAGPESYPDLPERRERDVHLYPGRDGRNLRASQMADADMVGDRRGFRQVSNRPDYDEAHDILRDSIRHAVGGHMGERRFMDDLSMYGQDRFVGDSGYKTSLMPRNGPQGSRNPELF